MQQSAGAWMGTTPMGVYWDLRSELTEQACGSAECFTASLLCSTDQYEWRGEAAAVMEIIASDSDGKYGW